ncbi:MAG: SH3 beta-barrel fold-containing protein [Bacteroidales bacterium]
MRTKEFLSQVMKLAWQLAKMYGLSISEAMHKSWTALKLKLAMKKGIVKFFFEKLNGEARTAWGTLEESRIPVSAGSEKKKNDTVMTFFDTEKNEFRCFKIVNIIKIA